MTALQVLKKTPSGLEKSSLFGYNHPMQYVKSFEVTKSCPHTFFFFKFSVSTHSDRALLKDLCKKVLRTMESSLDF